MEDLSLQVMYVYCYIICVNVSKAIFFFPGYDFCDYIIANKNTFKVHIKAAEFPFYTHKASNSHCRKMRGCVYVINGNNLLKQNQNKT